MSPSRFCEPRLFVARAAELPISGQALLDLMEAVLLKGGALRFRARGWSMAPFIRDEDVITVAPLAGVRPRLGEVVAFVRPGTGRLVVHRVIGTLGEGANLACRIRGDSGPGCEDGPVNGENILGRVTRVQRGGRDVWLGLGPERTVIAWLSRSGRLASARGWLPSPLRALLQ